VLAGLGVFAAVFLLALNPPKIRLRLGLRGVKRQQAMKGNFRMIEPAVRYLAGLVEGLPIDNLRRAAGRQLSLGGDYLGLTPNEYIALSILSGLGAMVVGVACLYVYPSPWVIVGWTVLGVFAPYSYVQEAIRVRHKHVNAALPAAVELSALCLGAGLDFPGAIRQVIETAPDRTKPLYEELAYLLRELDLGRTREAALRSFSERVPTVVVRDFVSAVIQAERKGTPLADVLRIQASLQRTGRSTRIEEGAARASVLMNVPLLLLLLATMTVLFSGPVLRYMNEF
jgi:tight adherence protein C